MQAEPTVTASEEKNISTLKNLAELKLILPIEEGYFKILDDNPNGTLDVKKEFLMNLNQNLKNLPNDLIESILNLLDKRYEGRRFFQFGKEIFGESFTEDFSYDDCKNYNFNEDKIISFLQSDDCMESMDKWFRTDDDEKEVYYEEFPSKKKMHCYDVGNSFISFLLHLSFEKKWSLLQKEIGEVSSINGRHEMFFVISKFLDLNREKNEDEITDFLKAYQSMRDEDFRPFSLEVLCSKSNDKLLVQFPLKIIDWIVSQTVERGNDEESSGVFRKYCYDALCKVLQTIENFANNDIKEYFKAKYPDQYPKLKTEPSNQATTTATQASTTFMDNPTNDSRKRGPEDGSDDANKKQRSSSPEPS